MNNLQDKINQCAALRTHIQEFETGLVAEIKNTFDPEFKAIIETLPKAHQPDGYQVLVHKSDNKLCVVLNRLNDYNQDETSFSELKKLDQQLNTEFKRIKNNMVSK